MLTCTHHYHHFQETPYTSEDIPPQSEILKEVLFSFVPLFALIMLVLGTILAGIATPAEAAAAGAFGALVLSYFYKTLKWENFKQSVFLTAVDLL